MGNDSGTSGDLFRSFSSVLLGETGNDIEMLLKVALSLLMRGESCIDGSGLSLLSGS
jgi:hypothetical protein